MGGKSKYFTHLDRETIQKSEEDDGCRYGAL